MAKQGLTLEQKQTQRLALEQQRLLGMVLEKNDAEMAEFIDNKVNEIQALEKKSDENDEYDNSQDNDRGNEHPSEAEVSAETSGDDDTLAWYRYFANNRSRDDEYYTPTAVNEKSLQEFLADQLGELELDETQQMIARAIVGNIEDNGYLRRSAAEIADDVTFNDGYVVDAQQVDFKKYFDEMGAMRFDSIGRKMGVTKEQLEEVFKRQIRRGLNPFPGNAFESRMDSSQQVTPDFDVEIDEDNDRLTVTLRNNIPTLQISESYALMNERYKKTDSLSVKETKEKKQIQDAFQRASMFIEVLKQRQETLFNTMSAIVKCQRDYFMSGDERDLKPLGQQQIADMIGKDVSVVSRAVSNKYVQLPWGIKSLKSFFSEDINGASRHEVYDDLKKLIDAEDKAHPLSDDALCDRLKEMGYKLERRTVAKYREALKIPSSSVRRKMAK